MIKKIYILSISLGLAYGAIAQTPDRANRLLLKKDTSLSPQIIAELDMGKNTAYLNENEKDMLFLINYVRRFGSRFIHIYFGEYWNRYHRQAPKKEEVKQLNQLLNELNLVAQTPREILQIDSNLCAAARTHAQYMGLSGNLSHLSADGTTPAARLNKFGRSGVLAEMYALGNSPLEMVFLWLLDSKDSSKLRNRRNMLRPEFRYVGLGFYQGFKKGNAGVVSFDTDQQ
ncbi:MAG: CAP domain-containing protein [Microscillaceae bacterium]|nr:CAP domain-containing protein [Microscillaceae bacterium]